MKATPKKPWLTAGALTLLRRVDVRPVPMTELANSSFVRQLVSLDYAEIVPMPAPDNEPPPRFVDHLRITNAGHAVVQQRTPTS